MIRGELYKYFVTFEKGAFSLSAGILNRERLIDYYTLFLYA